MFCCDDKCLLEPVETIVLVLMKSFVSDFDYAWIRHVDVSKRDIRVSVRLHKLSRRAVKCAGDIHIFVSVTLDNSLYMPTTDKKLCLSTSRLTVYRRNPNQKLAPMLRDTPSTHEH